MTTGFRAVAFDLDGLMFDTEALFVRVATAMLSERGKVFTPEIMAAMIGRQAAIAYPALKAMVESDQNMAVRSNITFTPTAIGTRTGVLRLPVASVVAVNPVPGEALAVWVNAATATIPTAAPMTWVRLTFICCSLQGVRGAEPLPGPAVCPSRCGMGTGGGSDLLDARRS